jgi:hypothetical protein
MRKARSINALSSMEFAGAMTVLVVFVRNAASGKRRPRSTEARALVRACVSLHRESVYGCGVEINVTGSGHTSRFKKPPGSKSHL